MIIYTIKMGRIQVECIPRLKDPVCRATWGGENPGNVELAWPGPEYYRDSTSTPMMAADLLAELYFRIQQAGIPYMDLTAMTHLDNYEVTEVGDVPEEWILLEAWAGLMASFDMEPQEIKQAHHDDRVDAIVSGLYDSRHMLANLMDPFYCPRAENQMDLFE